MSAFSTVCHQISERSFQIANISLAVCHRCTGIYAGIPLAMLAMAIAGRFNMRKNVWGLILFVSLLIMGLDWGLTAVEVWENTLLSRLLTGLFFGLSAGAYLALVVANKETINPTSNVDNPKTNFV